MLRERRKSEERRQGQTPKSAVGLGPGHSSDERTVMVRERRTRRVLYGKGSTTPSPYRRRHRKIDWHQTRGTILLTPKHFLDAYHQVRKNKGAAGVDSQSLRDFAERLESNLVCLWSRVVSGSYHPPAVRRVGIPKGDGKTRYLGIPTVGDRIVQQVIKTQLEPRFEREFLDCSYGYRSGRSAHDALQVVRLGVRKTSWVVDMDVAKFFDELPHDLLRKALDRHVSEGWIRLLIDRWLEAPHYDPQDNDYHYRQGRGTPQGGVISPLLANLFLHYVLDKWLLRQHPDVKLVRYADDAILLCNSRTRAEWIKELLEDRFAACGLRLHPEKTKIVFCKTSHRQSSHRTVSFDFLGYRFQPSTKQRQNGSLFLSFDCKMSPKKSKAAIAKLRSMKFHLWNTATIEEVAAAVNPILRGLLNYFGRFNKHQGLDRVMHAVNSRLAKWVSRKYKRSPGRAWRWLCTLAGKQPNLFAHWGAGFAHA